MTPVSAPIQRPLSAPAAEHQIQSFNQRLKSPAEKNYVVELTSCSNNEAAERTKGLKVIIERQPVVNPSQVGGTSEVVFAKISGSETPVAMKVISGIAAKYLQDVEVGCLKAIDGARNVARIRGYGSLEVEEVIVEDKAGDKSLVEYILEREQGKLEELEALSFIQQLLEILRDIHAKNVVHCDIKPDNLVVSDGGEVILVDFGSAKRIGDKKASCIGGTKAYFSPNQALKTPLDDINSWFPIDIWAAGGVLHSAITGRPLFYKFQDVANNDQELALLEEMQEVFGKFPDKMVEAAPEDIRDCFEKKKSIFGTRYELIKKYNFERLGLEKSLKNEGVDPSIIKILKKMFSYENRPTAKELLKLKEMQRSVGFKVEVLPPKKGLKLLMISRVRTKDEIELIEKKFELDEKSFNKIHHYIPKSEDGKYQMVLLDDSESILGCSEIKIEDLEDSLKNLLSEVPADPEIQYTNLTINAKNFENFEGLKLIVESGTGKNEVETVFYIDKSNKFRFPKSENNKYKITIVIASGERLVVEAEMLPGKSYLLDLVDDSQ